MADEDDTSLNIVFRGEWGAQPSEVGVPLISPVTYVIHTFTGTESCYGVEECIKIVKDIQSQDIANKLEDIKYK